MTLTRLPAADCRGGKAGAACSTKRRTGNRTEGRDALINMFLNDLQTEDSPQPDGVGGSEGIVVGVCEVGELTEHQLACKKGEPRTKPVPSSKMMV